MQTVRQGFPAIPLLWRLFSGFVAVLLAALGAPAWAQTSTFSNTSTGAINDLTCGTGGVLTRTFVVGSSFTLSDVNLGILLSHTYRSDLRITLTSPAGTTVAIMTNVGGSGDNLNDLFDDGAATNISAHNGTSTDSATGAPPYSHSARPTVALSAFTGQNSAGTWTLTICDSAGADTGTFTRADLYLTQVPSSYADLSLTKTVSSATPASGGAISYTLTVRNAASPSLTATGVTVLDAMPAGFSYTGVTGAGSYNSGTGVWTVGSLAPGATASITISGTVSASSGATIINTAEITASSLPDIDSTPNNGATGEDDFASVSFTVSGTRVAGTPPTLVCPAGSTLYDWDLQSWTAGSLSGSYALANVGTISWSMTNDGAWLTNATYGGLSPAKQTAVTGGIAGATQSLFLYPDFATISQVQMSTLTLPTAVPALQFRIFDVDYNAGQFADRVKVSGLFNGATVIPTLTNGTANYVIGNTAYGDQLSADTAAAGNIVITFTSPVDTIIIEYGNHSLSPADPGGQAIALHDITMCRPQATLTIAKTSSVISDPVNGTTNPAMIPGAVVQYCLLVSNSGSATTTTIAVTDTLPSNVTYIPGSMVSGPSCAASSTVEDDNASGGDENDPFGGQISGTTIVGTAASLGPTSSFALLYSTTVN